jgi:hypothetical protein
MKGCGSSGCRRAEVRSGSLEAAIVGKVAYLPDEDSKAASMSKRPRERQCRALIYFNSCMDMSYAWIAAFARAATSATIIPGL